MYYGLEDKEMLIEDYWVDSTLYYVEFITLDGRVIKKELIFPMGLPEEWVRDFVKSSFAQVKEVKLVEYMSEVLCPKG